VVRQQNMQTAFTYGKKIKYSELEQDTQEYKDNIKMAINGKQFEQKLDLILKKKMLKLT
tara:strand:+ start:105 stop:281 length:177 start_codon:yes stop_codon:yes gene_type:complete